jgi:hypothetical protein
VYECPDDPPIPTLTVPKRCVCVAVTMEGGGIYQEPDAAIVQSFSIISSVIRGNVISMAGSASSTSLARGGGE